MNKKERAKDGWIQEIMEFQRIAGTGVETYEELSQFYDTAFGRLSTKERETLADNAKTQTTILKVARDAGNNRRN